MSIKHYGVLGMKWGQRKERNWEKKVSSTRSYIKVYNKTADSMNATVIPNINNNPRYKNKNFNDPKNEKLKNQYLKEYEDAFNKFMKEHSLSELGTSPSGTKQAIFSYDFDAGEVKFEFKEVKHSLENGDVVFIGKLDSFGMIISLIFDEEKSNNLSHTGVKGMKWGVRKDKRTPSQEHVRSRKLQKKKIFEMSNEELQTVAGRLELENRYKNVSSKKFDKVSKKVSKAVDSYGNQVIAGLAGAAAVKTVEIILKKIKN